MKSQQVCYTYIYSYRQRDKNVILCLWSIISFLSYDYLGRFRTVWATLLDYPFRENHKEKDYISIVEHSNSAVLMELGHFYFQHSSGYKWAARLSDIQYQSLLSQCSTDSMGPMDKPQPSDIPMDITFQQAWACASVKWTITVWDAYSM